MPKVIQRVSGRTQGKLRFVLKKKKKAQKGKAGATSPLGSLLALC